MSFDPASTGSLSMSQTAGAFRTGLPSVSRESTEARSKRNPSTCISETQWRSASSMSRRTTGWLAFRVFPQPVKLA